MDFLKWYKNKIELNDLEPPEIIWENIQDELDINRSWQTINHYLDQRISAKRIYILTLAASFLIFVSTGIYMILKPDMNQIESQFITEKTNEPENKTTISNVNKNNQLSIDENSQEPNILEFTSEIIVGKEHINDRIENIYSEENSNRGFVYAKLDSKTDFLRYDLNGKIIISRIDFSYSEDKTSKYKAFQKLYMGATGQLANTWLLNNKTYGGMESTSLTSSKASFGANFGIFIGTNLTKNIDLNTELNILVQNNQNYYEYINGHYTETQMKFNYSQLELSLRYNFMSKRFLKGEHGINSGGYLGYLHSAYQNIDTEITDISGIYNTLDYGIFLSYEYVIPVYKKLGFGTGIRAYYGLNNIYSGDAILPAYMNITNNASVNFSLSLRYSIK